MRGHRPQFKVMIYGDNLWGHHLINVNGALDLEPVNGWLRSLMKGGSTRESILSNPTEVEGIEQFVALGLRRSYGLGFDRCAAPRLLCRYS